MVTLENITNEGFLQGIHRMFRKSVLPFTFLGFGSLAFNGCGKKDNPAKSDYEEEYQDIIRERYTNPVNNPPPFQPISPDDLGLNLSKSDAKITSSDGKAFFNEAGNPETVEIRIQDSSGMPIESFEVVYLDGQGHEAFFGNKEGYLPTFGIFPHNSVHTLKSEKIDRGFLHLQTIQTEEEFGALIRFDKKDLFPTKVEYVYQETISENDRIELYNQQLVVARLFDLGAKFVTGQEKPTINVFGIKLPLSMEKLAPYLSPYGEDRIGGKSLRYDVYRITTRRTINRDGKELKQDLIEIFPSNVPTVVIEDGRVEGSSLFLDWKGDDKDRYERAFFGLERENSVLARQDATILRGKTTGSDLVYDFTLSRDGRLVTSQLNTEFVGIKLDSPQLGNYRLEVKVRDEVGNESTTVKEFSLVKKEESLLKPRVEFLYKELTARDNVASSPTDPISLDLKLAFDVYNPQFDQYKSAGSVKYELQKNSSGGWTTIPTLQKLLVINLWSPVVGPEIRKLGHAGMEELQSDQAYGAAKVRIQIVYALNGAAADTTYSNEVPISSR